MVEEYPSFVGATTERGIDIARFGTEVNGFVHEYCAMQFNPKPYSRTDRAALAAALAFYRGLDDWRPTWVLSYAHDVAGSRAGAALHLAYDASFWETKAPEMNSTTVSAAWRSQLFGWYAKNRDAFGGSRQLADVAVLYSPASRDVFPGHFSMLRLVLEMLLDARIPFRVLATRDLAQVTHYRTVILPSVVALSPDDATRLRASGVRLFVVAEPPSKDAWGLRPQDARLRVEHVGLHLLPAALTAQPVVVAGGTVAVNVVQRWREIQVRLANLEQKPAVVTVSLKLPSVRAVTRLSLLGREETQPFDRAGDTLRLRVPVADLTVLRLKLR
jgi:hypothetical protein